MEGVKKACFHLKDISFYFLSIFIFLIDVDEYGSVDMNYIYI